ncbi:MAG TPA: SUMF1/EgtB/PvdO family nonheme iron enzyme [Polyangiaceae bacterium]|nr:SUMF1/EgtB/PvdO family nonheme iron enzyme [Polyangiaceae bacterium]
MGDYALRKVVRRSTVARKPRRTNKNKDQATARVELLLFCACALAVVGCGDEPGKATPINVKARGALVSVGAGETTVGFVRGTARVPEKTGAFQISAVPITKKQFRACEAAGICKSPDIEECSDPGLARAALAGPDEAAAICVGRENAQKYCEWVGGRLPTLAEWLRAARGPSVQEYPWGGNRASCAQHPKSVEGTARFLVNAGHTEVPDGCDPTDAGAMVTGRHPAGAASDSGMQDVLITPAELVVGYDHSPFAACSRDQHCLVVGMNPGSIDSVKPFAVGTASAEKTKQASQVRLSPEAYGFRCVIEK